VLTLDDPDVRNALSLDMATALTGALSAVDPEETRVSDYAELAAVGGTLASDDHAEGATAFVE
jgi:enoyl-CoA hydratase/carnithine racemase